MINIEFYCLLGMFVEVNGKVEVLMQGLMSFLAIS